MIVSNQKYSTLNNTAALFVGAVTRKKATDNALCLLESTIEVVALPDSLRKSIVERVVQPPVVVTLLEDNSDLSSDENIDFDRSEKKQKKTVQHKTFNTLADMVNSYCDGDNIVNEDHSSDFDFSLLASDNDDSDDSDGFVDELPNGDTVDLTAAEVAEQQENFISAFSALDSVDMRRVA